MDSNGYNVKKYILQNNETELVNLLNRGFNPNHEGGWPIRLAARYGLYSTVKLLIQFGANPHLISEAGGFSIFGSKGASTLQLAVYSGEFWNTDKWAFLLSSCDSSQLADAAAVAVIFYNIAALKKIMETGRCNTHIPTSLTGKTVEELAKGYKLQNVLHTHGIIQSNVFGPSPFTSPGNIRQSISFRRGSNATVTAHYVFGSMGKNTFIDFVESRSTEFYHKGINEPPHLP